MRSWFIESFSLVSVRIVVGQSLAQNKSVLDNDDVRWLLASRGGIKACTLVSSLALVLGRQWSEGQLWKMTIVIAIYVLEIGSGGRRSACHVCGWERGPDRAPPLQR